MARKKTYPGGFRLTLATARALVVQEFGTAKGLEPDRGTCLEGFFTMRMGNMGISISPRRWRRGWETSDRTPATSSLTKRGKRGGERGRDLQAGKENRLF